MLCRKPSELILLLNRLFLCIEDMQSSWSIHFTILARVLPGYRGKWTDVNNLSKEMITVMGLIREKEKVLEISFDTHYRIYLSFYLSHHLFINNNKNTLVL